MKNLRKAAAIIVSFFLIGLPPAYASRELPLLANKTLSMDLQNANLKDVLKIFSIQSGLNFIAAQNVEDRKITLFLDKVPIQEGMTKLFEANNLTFEYDKGSNIYVVKFWGEPQMDLLTKIYTLKNRSVASSRLEREKDALMAESGVSKGFKGTVGGGAQDAGSLKDIVSQVISKNGKICEDKRTNSLIITDIPSRFPVIDELIARLDTPQPMVMLEVEILDVSKSALDKLGIDVGSMDSPNALSLAFPRGLRLSGISAGFSTPSGVPNVTSGHIDNFTYSAVLDFIRQETDARYLARPKILTMSNETAEIGIVKDEIVNIKTEITAQQNGPSTTTTTYQRATDLPLTGEGVGIFLRVTPQVNLDTNEIMMVVNPKSSSAAQDPLVPTTDANGNAQVAKDPEVRTTKSFVKVKDGETIALGGLIHKETQTTLRKLPILGDIPFLGVLFRHKTTDTDIDRELLVFITPRIVREPGSKVAKAPESAYALQYLSSGLKRKQEIENLLDTYEAK
jgi:type II secretory pathway component GspD/PulD (secretin)